ncbi:ATP-binding protein [Streptomyces sp. NPDC057137]|uniref:ATP-binding protein n=1 Tax=Streptomyces sp. NPDC057137 TaxID=3346030 RepID=UPI003640DF0B
MNAPWREREGDARTVGERVPEGGRHKRREPERVQAQTPLQAQGPSRREPASDAGKRRRFRPRSLRVRLVFSFVLVAALSALGTGALTFQQARTGVLQQSQDTVVNQFRRSVDAAIPGLTPTLGQEELDSLVGRLAREHQAQQGTVLATYGDLRAASAGPTAPDVLTPALRASVEQRAVAVFQRVQTGDHSSLVVGLPVTYTDGPYTSRTLSGLTLYLVVPQKSEQAYVDALVRAVERATLPALGLAALLALLLARGVLRPVRALRRATRRMADGHLDTRLSVQGSDELADLAEAFNDTAAALEESVTELRRMEAGARRFAADVSHELRTPLSAMTAVTDVLAEEMPGLDGDAADAVRLITEETVRLARLVDDLMEISRFDAHAAELGLDELDLAESLRRTLSIRGWLHDVDTDLPDGIRARVDPRRLDVVVANLVGNALRHGGQPVALTLRRTPHGPTGPRPVRGEAETQCPVVVIEVSDRGPGVPEAALPQLFDRFFKVSSARSRSESSGLGLAITQENVHLHGGRIRAANRPGGGAVFTVELPLRPHGTREPQRHGEQPIALRKGEDE